VIFWFPGLLIELPVTTTVMLHSIAEIARSQGEDLRNPESALACLEVFCAGAGSGACGCSGERVLREPPAWRRLRARASSS